MRIQQITAPDREPVYVAEAKLHLRLEHDLEDAYIAGLITAAREYAELVQGRILARRQLRMILDGWPTGAIETPVPLVSVDELRYRAADGSTVTVPSSAYTVGKGDPGTVSPAGQWPTDALSGPASVELDITCGMLPDEVPHVLRAGILMLVAQWYERRTGMVTGTLRTEIPVGIDRMLSTGRRVAL